MRSVKVRSTFRNRGAAPAQSRQSGAYKLTLAQQIALMRAGVGCRA